MMETSQLAVETSKPAPIRKHAREETSSIAIRIEGLYKTYTRGKEALDVIKGLDLKVPDGSFEALMGPSGSGKSTLLNIIAGLDRPTRGRVEVGGVNLASLSDGKLARWRAENIGFVFQTYNLVPVLSALENVELPLKLSRLSAAERRKRARTALSVVGLAEREHHRPNQLSGGQEQRVAIARAIVTDPKVLVADEPTGDLDRKSADEILLLLKRLNEEFEKTIIMVTHDPAAAACARTTHTLNKGSLV